MINKIIANILKKIGGINLGLRISEYILRRVDLSWEIPYKGYVNDVIEQLKKIAEDGTITSDELASVLKHFRENRE